MQPRPSRSSRSRLALAPVAGSSRDENSDPGASVDQVAKIINPTAMDTNAAPIPGQPPAAPPSLDVPAPVPDPAPSDPALAPVVEEPALEVPFSQPRGPMCNPTVQPPVAPVAFGSQEPAPVQAAATQTAPALAPHPGVFPPLAAAPTGPRLKRRAPYEAIDYLKPYLRQLHHEKMAASGASQDVPSLHLLPQEVMDITADQWRSPKFQEGLANYARDYGMSTWNPDPVTGELIETVHDGPPAPRAPAACDSFPVAPAAEPPFAGFRPGFLNPPPPLKKPTHEVRTEAASLRVYHPNRCSTRPENAARGCHSASRKRCSWPLQFALDSAARRIPQHASRKRGSWSLQCALDSAARRTPQHASRKRCSWSLQFALDSAARRKSQHASRKRCCWRSQYAVNALPACR